MTQQPAAQASFPTSCDDRAANGQQAKQFMYYQLGEVLTNEHPMTSDNRYMPKAHEEDMDEFGKHGGLETPSFNKIKPEMQLQNMSTKSQSST